MAAVTSLPYARLTLTTSSFKELFGGGVVDATGARLVVVPDDLMERAITAAMVQILREAKASDAIKQRRQA
jgi:hypothetical protein